VAISSLDNLADFFAAETSKLIADKSKNNVNIPSKILFIFSPQW
jgi:hypothetical protein